MIIVSLLATQLFKLLDKYRPETKQAKKERLRERAAARFVPLSTTFNWMMGCSLA